jgi:Ala-tRNA(Pro) deacylase
MPDKTELLAFLNQAQIAYELEEHAAIFNMADSATLALGLQGARCKNLLLKDKSGRCYLVMTTGHKSLDLGALATALDCARLSFATPERLFEQLGVRPGALSPLALINDGSGNTILVMDAELAVEPVFILHPLENSSSVALTRESFDQFLVAIGHTARWLPLAARKAVADQ